MGFLRLRKPLERDISKMKNVYIALDFPDGVTALKFIDTYELTGVPVKVGMELFYREGPQIINELKDKGHEVFLDLKLYDIPNTVGQAMKNLATLGVDIVNVHATGGGEMIAAAKEGLLQGKPKGDATKLIAVTVLTSFEQREITEQLKVEQSIESYATHLATLAKNNGADGVVCSVHEAKQIKDACGDSFLTVTPGIRLANSPTDDQERIATPTFAKSNGSDILVVGRSITQANNPRLAYDQVIEEWTK